MQITWSEAERRCSSNRRLSPLHSRLSTFLFLLGDMVISLLTLWVSCGANHPADDLSRDGRTVGKLSALVPDTGLVTKERNQESVTLGKNGGEATKCSVTRSDGNLVCAPYDRPTLWFD